MLEFEWVASAAAASADVALIDGHMGQPAEPETIAAASADVALIDGHTQLTSSDSGSASAVSADVALIDGHLACWPWAWGRIRC